MIDSKATIAVIGLGLIGASWTALFLSRGFDVRAWDPSETAVANFPKLVERALDQLNELGNTAENPGTLTVVQSLQEAVKTAQLIQENAPEKVALKRALYKEIEQSASEHAIIASSTSSLTWSELSEELVHKDRFVTAHPFNPPHLMPLVEIYAADAQVRDDAVDFYERMGRKAVILARDAVGHIANRLSSALWREAVHIVADGIADVSAVDAALVHGPGLRWSIVGTHMAYHLGGGSGGIAHYLQHLGPSQELRWSTLGTPTLSPDVCGKLAEGIAAEAQGRSIEELEEVRDRALIAILKAGRETV